MTDKKKKTNQGPTQKALSEIYSNLNLDEIGMIADLGCGFARLTSAIQQRFDCDVMIIPLNGKGNFDKGSKERGEEYRKKLIQAGVDESRITILSKQPKSHSPVDLIISINSFGNGKNPASAKKWLDILLGAESRLLMDIRNGSGGYGVIRPYGNVNTLRKTEQDGKTIARVILSVEPNAVARSNTEKWRETAMPLIGESGFYREEGAHSFTFIQRSDILVVTFDNLDIAMDKREDRKPWGFSFIEKKGWSMLGVMAAGWTWYRDPWVSQQFDQLRDEGFFDQFQKVIFYGASMGGYAACTFSRAAPGSKVIAFSPQSILDKTIVPWETRYKIAWHYDYSDHYGDAAQTIQSAGDAYLFYDPYLPLDNQHAARMKGDNVHHFRAPLMGHKVGSSFQRMDILQALIEQSVAGTLTQPQYRELFQARKSLRRYLFELYNKIDRQKTPARARIVAQAGQANDPKDRFFVNALKELA